MDAYIGDIRLFAGNFAPVGWILCNGTLLNISEYDAVYAIIGTTYGGDGINTFAVPDLRGRLPVGQGNGPGLTPRVLGQAFGSESVTLSTTQIPSHTHTFAASTATATASSPAASVFAQNGVDSIYTPLPASGPQPQILNAASVMAAGGSQPHDNIMPTTAINYIMCLAGIFPSRN